MDKITVALAGNPNAGKTTIFNAITGARQHVGNYPGVTVEKKEGARRRGGVTLNVVDLPGTYSLTAYTEEEVVARNVLIEEGPDVVVDIVDASTLERNLYLATQLVELDVPLVLAFNMTDVAKTRGIHIDIAMLSELLGVPIVPTVGHRGEGIDELLDTCIEVARDRDRYVSEHRHVYYGHEIEPHFERMTGLIADRCPNLGRPRWFAVKLLEDDAETKRRLGDECGDEALERLVTEAHRLRRHIEGVSGDTIETLLADRRYGFISGACAEAVTRSASRREISDVIDRVITHRWLGLPIFAVLMFIMFQITFTLGNPVVDFLDAQKERLAGWLADTWPGQGLLESLVVDGIIGGVGAVVVFVPLIALLFLTIAFLEDTGYMARAAFVIDRIMHKVGLHGKSFIPMLIGFGCTVPGILATRTLETRRDRLTTILILPLMSCGARLPIYVLILGAFFPERSIDLGVMSVSNQALWLLLIYCIGVVLAVIAGNIFRHTILRGEPEPLVMELPPYRLPVLKGLTIHTWERTWLYLKKAGTVILGISIVLWALGTWPKLPEDKAETYRERIASIRADETLEDEARIERVQAVVAERQQARLTHSIIGRIGHGVAPVFKPLGFDWRISTALIGAFAAKEVFVSQMGVVFALGEEAGEDSPGLKEKLQTAYTPLIGFCIMLFCLIGTPCMATVAVTIRETGSWKWGLFQLAYLTAAAWVVTAVVYQVGSRL